MILKDLRIKLNEYGENKGRYTGEALFSGENGSVQLRLSETQCNRIFSMCAESIVEVASETAIIMTSQVLEHSNAVDGEQS